MKKNIFESKQFSIVLALLILLGISGVFMLGDADTSTQKISQTLETIEEDFEENAPFEEEDEVIDPDYEDEISKQYEEYQKLQEENDKDKPKEGNKIGNVGSTVGDKDRGSTPSKPSNGGSSGNTGGSNSGGSKPSTGGNTGGNNGGNDPIKIELPPINIGSPNPTVPKLPSNPKPEPKPTEPTNPTDPTTPTDPEEPTDPENPTNPEDPEDPEEPTDPEEPGTPGDGGTTPDPEDPTDPNPPPVQGGDGDFGSITPVDRPDPIDTDPHPPLTDLQDSARTGGQSMVGTNYGNGYRILAVNYETSVSGATAKFEFYNESDSPITLKSSNIYFDYDRGYDDRADSWLAEEPLVVQPKSTATLNVSTSYSDATSVEWNFNGDKSAFNFAGNKTNINNVTPLPDNGDLINGEFVELTALNDVKGTKDFKAEPLGIILSGNNSIGPLKKEPNGALGLLKVRIANTSSSPITIKNINVLSIDYASNPWNLNRVSFPLSDLNLLGGNALSTTLPAKTIVEGYVPFYLKDGNHVGMVYLDTNKGGIQFNSVESYGIIYNP